MVGTNYCPLNGKGNPEEFMRKELKKYGIDVKDRKELRREYCLRCPVITC